MAVAPYSASSIDIIDYIETLLFDASDFLAAECWPDFSIEDDKNANSTHVNMALESVLIKGLDLEPQQNRFWRTLATAGSRVYELKRYFCTARLCATEIGTNALQKDSRDRG